MSLEYVKKKIIIIGPNNSGKTSFINKFYNPNFNTDKIINSTIGTDFYICNYVLNNIKFKLFIWDTAGNKMYNNMNSIISSVDKIIIFFDFNNIQNYKYYIDLAQKYQSNNNIIIVYNKVIDETLLLNKYINENIKNNVYNIKEIFINVKNNININNVFKELLDSDFVYLNKKKCKCVIQ